MLKNKNRMFDLFLAKQEYLLQQHQQKAKVNAQNNARLDAKALGKGVSYVRG